MKPPRPFNTAANFARNPYSVRKMTEDDIEPAVLILAAYMPGEDLLCPQKFRSIQNSQRRSLSDSLHESYVAVRSNGTTKGVIEGFFVLKYGCACFPYLKHHASPDCAEAMIAAAARIQVAEKGRNPLASLYVTAIENNRPSQIPDDRNVLTAIDRFHGEKLRNGPYNTFLGQINLSDYVVDNPVTELHRKAARDGAAFRP